MECKDIAEIIISGVAAAGTLAAVIVALWQTKFQLKRKLKLKPSRKAQILQGPNNVIIGQSEIFGLTVINLGFREISITGWGVYFNKKDQLSIINLKSNTTKQIKPEESLNYHVPKNELYSNIMAYRSYDKRIEKRRLKFYVTDIAGKMHVKRTSFRIKDLA